MSEILDFVNKYWQDENCAKTSSRGILEYFNYHEAGEILFKAFVPFGEGLDERLICGAVVGSVAALSYILSEKSLTKQEIYEKTEDFKTAFRKEFGSIQCSELLYPAVKREEPYPKDPVRQEICTKAIEKAVLEVERIVKSLI